VALGLHAILGSAIVYATIQAVEEVQQEEVYVELTHETFVPPPPPPPPPPTVEVPQAEQVRGFQTIQIPTVIPTDIPPPAPSFRFREEDFLGEGLPGGIRAGRASSDSVAPPSRETPSFTPHTVKPGLTNAEEVQRALVREYPSMLRDAQIGGSVVVWLFIDTEGRVENSKVQTSSGYPMLDAAALDVANTMRFTPAYNRDQKVPVWVSIPITFRVTEVR
jgi:protein TonB